MTDSNETPDGTRLAKVIARAGLASRRDAEVMIADLRVMVNGRTISSPATNVQPSDKITVDGKPLPQADGTRLWLYHKPAGLVTTERDEKDRETVFDALRDTLGRVLSVGRLDLTSEGLLLLTNDGDLKRRLELPETGWLRRYRVRVNGKPDEAALQRLRDGITIEGETFQGMQVTFDRQQGANAWLTIGLREGRNREIRRAAEAVGLYVNRLIRVSYGPFQLGTLGAGEVEEIKPRVLRDQLGQLFTGEFAESRRVEDAPAKVDKRAPDGKRGSDRKGGSDGKRGPKSGARRPDGPERTREGRPDRDARPPRRTERTERGDRPDREARPRKPYADKTRPDRAPRDERSRDERPGKPRKDGKPARDTGDKRQSKSDKKAAMRADTSVSLRKGGQRGRGIAKAKRPTGGKPFTKPPRGSN